MKRHRIALVLIGLLAAGCEQRKALESVPTTSSSSESAESENWDAAPLPAASPVFAQDIAPVVAKCCLACHNRAKARGGVSLEGLAEEGRDGGRSLREKVADQLRSGNMPPPGRLQPTPAELETLNAWLDAELSGGTGGVQANAVVLHRLNRAEYNNTVRDLFFGLDLHPADAFPADDLGYGFDNIGEVLSLPPLLLEKYLRAAEEVVNAAFGDEPVRQYLLHPPPDDPILLPYRAVTYPVREEVQKRLILSAADLPPPDPAVEERERAYHVLRAFADRAYRRPVTHDELMRLLRFVKDAQENGDGAKGIRLAMRAILASPHFLFRVESIGLPGQTAAAGRLSDFELATRLSYFLWNSMPDEELFRHAARKTLRHRGNLSAQVRRMLRDPKARALGENFAGQWLQVRALKDLIPDAERFPDFDEPLRAAMLKETELFFNAIVREDRSILDFLDADSTFVNERLARHYGIRGVRGTDFVRVSLAGTARAGVLTQASVLTATSNPTRTSPVKRGRWVLDNILGSPPPPPPPGAGDLPDDSRTVRSSSLRQRLERHRADLACASCHRRMDPLGFGLENFDAIGAWRNSDGESSIDASGTLPGGLSFHGPAELRAVLKAQPDVFARCFTEKLLTYALGRGIERRDRRGVQHIVRQLARNDYRFSALVLALVHSDPLQLRRPGGVNP
jgi:Protein of unknown function (DUF1592)/Protein of unknown function (DUF1588)/Protein of unknown function (DUF1587)/Protein of unknown function (DUF1585)/Protein of unknown function (DUF1595)